MSEAKVFRWILDVESLWSSPHPTSERQLTKQWSDGAAAKQALSLLPPDEQARVLRFYFASDAKLSLGSCLLKRKAISDVCRVPWSEVVVGEDSNRKPCHEPNGSSGKTVEFNVSHHGTLVALVGCAGDSLKLGVDVVKMNWEKDYAMVLEEGFESWARTYEAVFSDHELNDITHFQSPCEADSREAIRIKLRHFYAHWCLKEAYVKMTGEALLAPWLKDLEFRNVQVPGRGSHLEGQDDWGQTCRDVEIWFHGKQVADVSLEILGFREEYMLATAASSPCVSISLFRELNAERDIYPTKMIVDH